MNFLNDLNGYYTVGDKIIQNKLCAFIEANKKNINEVKWHYFDQIFIDRLRKFADTNLSLSECYILRAKQLREKYDYLILNYSGGSDSHNILMTFIKNNIKLDHLYVQWPMNLVDKGIYNPNAIDKSNFNFHSEWDLVLKKDLEYIANSFPDIKIEIFDWTTTLKENFYNDEIFSKNVTNLPSIARSQKQNTFSETETKLANQGKLVASIYGVDKTEIVKKADSWFFYFVDSACMAQPNPENPNGLEYFYWTPDFPDIAIVQAFKLKNFYENNKNLQYLIQAKSERSCEIRNFTYNDFYKEFAMRAEIFKLVCYPHWDFNRFQADKPFAKLDGFKMGTRAWDNILTCVPNFDRIQQSWEYYWKTYLKEININLMRNQDTFSAVRTRWIKFS